MHYTIQMIPPFALKRHADPALDNPDTRTGFSSSLQDWDRQWDAEKAQDVAAAWADEVFCEEDVRRSEYHSLLIWPTGCPEEAFEVHLSRSRTYQAEAEICPLNPGFEFSAPCHYSFEASLYALPPNFAAISNEPKDEHAEDRLEYAYALLAARWALINLLCVRKSHYG